MASHNEASGSGCPMKEGIFFGDFDKDECNKFFKRTRAVQFAKVPSKDDEKAVVSDNSVQDESGNEGNLIKDVKSMALEVAAGSDVMYMDTADLSVHAPEENSQNKSNDQVFFGKTPTEDSVQKDEKIEVNEKDKDTAKSTLSADEGTSTPKAKPSSWAALFKSNSDVATTKASTIISVNFPEAATKEPITEATKVIYDQPPKLIPVEKDQDALALADFLHKSSLHPGNSVLQLRGLINNANWCYINATLQSLLGCSSFYCLFKAMHSIKPKSGKPSSTPLTDTMMDFANEFTTLDVRGFNNKGKKMDDLRLGISFEPKKVYDILSVLKSTLSETGKQQDAEEFLTFLLNGLHEEFLSLSKLIENVGKTNHFVTSSETSLVNGNIHDSNSAEVVGADSNKEEKVEDEWEQVGRNNKSANLRKAASDETFITRLFGGILRSSVHHAGAKESAMLQPFFTIQLDIQADNIWNIKDAFENYFTKESIEGFTSSKTNSKVEASHKTSLEKLPQVLILHLKYFVYDKTGGCQKTHKHVEIARELEIPKDVLSSSLKGRIPTNQRTYELFAVEFHLGKHAAGGHYTTAVKHKDPIGWVYCNDSIIQKTQFSQITKQQKDKVPYLLFYERVGHFGR